MRIKRGDKVRYIPLPKEKTRLTAKVVARPFTRNGQHAVKIRVLTVRNSAYPRVGRIYTCLTERLVVIRRKGP